MLVNQRNFAKYAKNCCRICKSIGESAKIVAELENIAICQQI